MIKAITSRSHRPSFYVCLCKRTKCVFIFKSRSECVIRRSSSDMPETFVYELWTVIRRAPHSDVIFMYTVLVCCIALFVEEQCHV